MTISLFIVFLLVSPAFCMGYGMRVGSKLHLEKSEHDSTRQMLSWVAGSVLLNLVLMCIYLFAMQENLSEYKSGILDLLNCRHQENACQYGFILDLGLFSQVVVYTLYSYSLSFVAGYLLTRFLESVSFREFLRNLFWRESEIISRCFVLTTQLIDSCYLMYRGTIHSVSYTEPNQIGFLTLKDVHRYLFSSTQKTLGTTTPTKITYLGKAVENPDVKDLIQSFLSKKASDGPENLLTGTLALRDENEVIHIKGECIANIFVARVYVDRDDITPRGVEALWIIFWGGIVWWLSLLGRI